MLTLDDRIKLEYAYMGQFIGEAGWIHPRFLLDTTEMILVTKGTVHLREGSREYTLQRGELFFLDPGVEHEGSMPSSEEVSFYWLHFRLSGGSIPYPKRLIPTDLSAIVNRFREWNHHSVLGRTSLLECQLLGLLLTLAEKPIPDDKLARDVAEYIRVKLRTAPTAKSVAEHFGYSEDHLSRRCRRTLLMSLKEYIIRERVTLIRNTLLTTDLSVKQIADLCGFSGENDLTKFFTYHTGEPPTAYRNRFSRSHQNDR